MLPFGFLGDSLCFFAGGLHVFLAQSAVAEEGIGNAVNHLIPIAVSALNHLYAILDATLALQRLYPLPEAG